MYESAMCPSGTVVAILKVMAKNNRVLEQRGGRVALLASLWMRVLALLASGANITHKVSADVVTSRTAAEAGAFD